MIKDKTTANNNLKKDYVGKITSLIEAELEDLDSTSSEDNIKIKKQVVELLHKLVNLIIHLNKLSKEEGQELSNKELSKNDKLIITEYLGKYQ